MVSKRAIVLHDVFGGNGIFGSLVSGIGVVISEDPEYAHCLIVKEFRKVFSDKSYF